MNMRKVYKQGLALGLSESGLRRWCDDIIKNGPDDKVGPALAILEELDRAAERERQKAEADSKLDRAIAQLSGQKVPCPQCNGAGVVEISRKPSKCRPIRTFTVPCKRCYLKGYING